MIFKMDESSKAAFHNTFEPAECNEGVHVEIYH